MNTRQKTTKQLWGCCLAALISCGASVSAAAADPEIRSVAVRYDDLNLASPAGIERLYGRIRQAAKVVCGDSGMRSLARLQAESQCRKQAIDDAVAAVGNQTLTAMHKEKTNRRTA